MTSTSVLAEIIGLPNLPSGISLTYMIPVAPCAVAQAIALQLRNQSSKGEAYLRVQILIGFMYLGAATCLWLIRGWKIGTVEVQR